MSNTNKNILEKVVKLTIEKKIRWHRIKTSIDLYSKENIMLKGFVDSYDTFDNPYTRLEKSKKNGLDLFESFIAEFETGNIYYFTYIDDDQEKYFLSLQSAKEAKILNLNDKYELQEDLKKLKYNISEQLDDVNGFINKLLEF